MTSLAELVDVVVGGLDTHKHTHTAAVFASGTGAEFEHGTVGTGPDGYGQFVAIVERHSRLRAWAMEGRRCLGATSKRSASE